MCGITIFIRLHNRGIKKHIPSTSENRLNISHNILAVKTIFIIILQMLFEFNGVISFFFFRKK